MYLTNWEVYRDKLTDPTVLDIKYGFPVDYAGQFVPVSVDKNHASADNAPEAKRSMGSGRLCFEVQQGD